MVTGATNDKVLYFNTPDRLQFLHDALLKLAKQYSWELQAWAVFANHYHFIAQSPENPKSLSALFLICMSLHQNILMLKITLLLEMFGGNFGIAISLINILIYLG